MGFTSIFYGDLSNEQVSAMAEYISNNALSLISSDSVDVSDVSHMFDTIHEYKFERTDEALLFKLKFPNRKVEG